MDGFQKEHFAELLTFFQERDSKIYAILKKRGYCKPPPKRNIFATLVGSIIGQKIRFSRARQLRQKLYILLGTDDFTLADIQKIDLSSVGLEKFQYDTIQRLIQFLQTDGICLETIAEVYKLKGQVKGIGPWTLGCTAIMHSLSHDDDSFDDRLLTEDLIIRRGLKKLYGDADYSQIAQSWTPWRGLVTWYLWKEYS